MGERLRRPKLPVFLAISQVGAVFRWRPTVIGVAEASVVFGVAGWPACLPWLGSPKGAFPFPSVTGATLNNETKTASGSGRPPSGGTGRRPK